MKTVVNLVKSITKEQGRTILAPHLEPLAEAIEHAWERWLGLPAKERKAIGTRARANLVYDLICEEIRLRFANVPGVSVEGQEHGMLWLNVEGVIVLRFKKLNKLKMGSNVATRFQAQFTGQLSLPGFPDEAARLVVGYQLDSLQSKITNILVTYRVGDRVEWYFSARESGSASGAIPATLPFPISPPRKPRVTGKKPESAAKNKNLRLMLGEGDEGATDEGATDEQRKTSDQ